jgi:hypothetical protein
MEMTQLLNTIKIKKKKKKKKVPQTCRRLDQDSVERFVMGKCFASCKAL